MCSLAVVYVAALVGFMLGFLCCAIVSVRHLK
jgi:hypothetical protein